MTEPRIWVVERHDHYSDDSEALAYTTDAGIAAAYTAQLNTLVGQGSGIRCYTVPLLTEAPEPFIGYSMVFSIDANGRIIPGRESSRLVLSQDTPEAADYPAEPLVRVWEPGEDGTPSGKDSWSVVGAGRVRGALEHACRLKVVQILNRGRAEEGHWQAVSAFTCPECNRLPDWDCDFGNGGLTLGFHQARLEAMKAEARRRAEVWRGHEMPLWVEASDPSDRWWEPANA